MENPMSASALSEESGSGTSWIVGGSGQENLACSTVLHRPIHEAPLVAREIAIRMQKSIDGAILPADESDTKGRVVVITGATKGRLPTKDVCLQALGIKTGKVNGRILLNEAVIFEKDYSELRGREGFCFNDDSDEYKDERNNHEVKIRETTAIMAAELTDHFELNFSENIVCAPVLYGGRASDGNLVAVLSMRVWT